jgi:prohibitin 2
MERSGRVVDLPWEAEAGGDTLPAIQQAMNPNSAVKAAVGVVLLLVLVLAASSSTYVVEPGHRGVMVTLGHVSTVFKPEGFGLKLPFISRIEQQTVQQQTELMGNTTCYSSDLQQVEMDLKVLYRVPETRVVSLYQDYEGAIFESLVKPRVAEALKEVTAMERAEDIVQQRETVKDRSLLSAREKIGDLLIVEDVVLEDIRLTDILAAEIEAKMVEEQEAARARFSQQQAEIDAQTKVIQAKGEAEAIRLQGQALRENPSVLDLQIVSQWDGVMPLVVGPGVEGADIILPLGSLGATNISGGIE